MRRVLILLAIAAIFAGGMYWLLRPTPTADTGAVAPRLVWVYTAPQPGGVIAAPLIDDESVYLPLVHARGFKLEGALYALDRATGKRKWSFDADDSMLPSASSPWVHQGRLYFGEGMHANFSCRLFCIDRHTGKQFWAFSTTDHVEGGPLLVGDRVIFPAGNDGLYAVDAMSGEKRWNFRADVHIDSTPTEQGGRLFVGSGPSRMFPSSQVICLDSATGQPVWRAPMNLPAWATPAVSRGRVFAGLGNGRLTEAAKPPETPSGALACLDASNGRLLWTFPVGDAVFGQPVVTDDRVVFGSRDGNLHCVSPDGRELFRLALGGPVIASPTIVDGLVYAISVPGRIVCLDSKEGHEVWRHETDGSNSATHAYSPIRVQRGQMFVASESRLSGSAVGIVSIACYDLPR